jgi:homoserine O-succinyltransferase
MIRIRSGPARVALKDASRELSYRNASPLVIGLVNNMPDAALKATERQFCDLLAEASPDLLIWVRFFSMPQLPRSEGGRAYVSQHYEDIDALWNDQLDGLIVTGAEPRAPILSDEPYWPTMVRLVDWAEQHAVSTVWSCLAAHAAVLHQDGIQRVPFRQKLSGVFECDRIAEHEIVNGTPRQWRMPHSRYHGLSEQELAPRGYCVVSRSPEVGPDMFVRQRQSLSIYLQGHPEYDQEALFREYRRDIREFVARQRESYPEAPRGYFDRQTAAEFDEFRRRAMRDRVAHVVLKFPEAERRLSFSWHEPAVRLYSNWLSYLFEHGHRRDSSKEAHPPNASPAA